MEHYRIKAITDVDGVERFYPQCKPDFLTRWTSINAEYLHYNGSETKILFVKLVSTCDRQSFNTEEEATEVVNFRKKLVKTGSVRKSRYIYLKNN